MKFQRTKEENEILILYKDGKEREGRVLARFEEFVRTNQLGIKSVLPNYEELQYI